MSIRCWSLAFVPLLLAALAAAQPYGIDTRNPNTTLRIAELPPAATGAMQVQRVFPSIAFNRPVLMVEAPDGSGRLFVVERSGRIKVFPKTVDPQPGDVSTYLDIASRVQTSGEQGLLGLAFDPDYGSNGEFYLYYSHRENNCSACTSRISRFITADPTQNVAVNPVEEVVLEQDQPYTNHNGGMIAFGPDNMLYIGFGDGGSGGDPLNAGQDLTTWLGSILRIDVRAEQTDPGKAYRVPRDNPFYADQPGPEDPLVEIYAYGLRNPWRFSFDPITGYLFAGDVGQGSYEEIDAIVRGGNYGWRYREGSHCYNPPQDCPTLGLIDPIAEYGRTEGRSVTGGFVYTGDAVPSLYGTYLYADYASHRVWGLRYDGENVDGPHVLVNNTGFDMAGFGLDADGEVYLLAFEGTGEVYVLRPAEPPQPSDFPRLLSDLPALYAAGSGVDQTTDGILPYEPSAKLWSDGADKERYLALPDLAQAGFRPYRGWDMPGEAAIVKNFILPLDERDPEATAKRIETRLLLKLDGRWHGFSYEWNDAETDATLLTGSKTRAFEIVDASGEAVTVHWLYPSSAQCLQCHTSAANFVLGLTTPQINHDFRYPASGVTDNQLRTLDHIALFTEPLPDVPANLPKMPDPLDDTAPLEARARAYLAANCAMCHQPDGPAPSTLDLRWEIATSEMNALGEMPMNGDLGIEGARVVAGGAPERSVLLVRMRQRGVPTQMPPLASSRVDEAGTALIEAWIRSLPPAGTSIFTAY